MGTGVGRTTLPVAAGPVLVVGGTGILRPAVELLRAGGRPVTVLSRSPSRLRTLPAGTAGVVGDLRNPAALRAALRSFEPPPQQPAAGLVYLPDAFETSGTAALRVLRGAVRGPLVVLLTSAAATPSVSAGAVAGPAAEAAPALAEPRTALAAPLSLGLRGRLAAGGTEPGELEILLLGWTSTDHRWHTPEEISEAALATLAVAEAPGGPRTRPGGASRTLGVLRPWIDRPG